MKKLAKLIIFWLLITSLTVTASYSVWLEDKVYLYDELEGFLDYWDYKVKEWTRNNTWHYYYPNSISWTWDVSFNYNFNYYAKVKQAITWSWYVWMLSGWTFEDNIWFMRLSASTADRNALYSTHATWTELKPSLQSSTWYWVWIDRNWLYNWKWHVNNEPYSVLNTFMTGSTAWRPMPFDRDWDALYDEMERLIFPWVISQWDIDSDTYSSWEKDWDSDGDWWSDWEEVMLWSDPKESSSTPDDSDGDFLSDAIDNDWCTEAYWDCDSDLLNNREEQQFWTNPKGSGNEDANWLDDTDWDWISDFIEYVFWMNPNVNEWNKDSDWDWLTDIDEISWREITITYTWSDLLEHSYTTIVYTDPYDADTDDDWFSDYIEIFIQKTDPTNPDTDWDWIPDWLDPFPLDWSGVASEYLDWDEDELPAWWEDKYSNWWDDGIIYTETWTEIWSQTKYNLDNSNRDSDWDLFLDWDEDFDQDWLTNLEEYLLWTNPNHWDSDWDGISDSDEINNWLNPNDPSDADKDFDWDWWSEWVSCTPWFNWLNNREEINTDNWSSTDPNSRDSDNDWISDTREINLWLDPSNPDSDWDWVLDWIELSLSRLDPWGSNSWDPNDPNNTPINSDSDLLYDIFEIYYDEWWLDWMIYIFNWSASWEVAADFGDTYALDETNSNSDGDSISDSFEDFDEEWLNNFQEQIYWTDPNNWDTDWDTMSDKVEIDNNFDPLDPSDWTNDNDWDWLTNAEEVNWIDMVIRTYSGCDLITWSGTITVYTDPNNPDTDWDGLDDKFEIMNWLDPTNPDTDWDWYLDWVEAALWTNPSDASDSPNASDTDMDWLPTEWENKFNQWWTGATVFTKDDPDWISWNEDEFQLNPSLNNSDWDVNPESPNDGFEDFDKDKLNNIEEFVNWTDPNNWDSDGDMMSDWDEVKYWLNPNLSEDANQDNDWDGLTNLEEINWIEIEITISCDDGSSTWWTIIVYTDPNNADTDWDWINDYDEIYVYWTDPTNPDSDWDWVDDWLEVNLWTIDEDTSDDDGWDPTDWNTTPLDDDNDWLYNIFEDYYSNWWSGGLVFINGSMTWIDVSSNSDYELNTGNWDSDWDNIWDANEDFDEDWLSNILEQFYWTDPNHWDTDWDGISDYDEIMLWLDPNWAWCINPDIDWDLLTNIQEIKWIPVSLTWALLFQDPARWNTPQSQWTWSLIKTNPLLWDTDSDGISDYDELYLHGSDPTNPDSDWDWVNDWVELSISIITWNTWSLITYSDSAITDEMCNWIDDEWYDYYDWWDCSGVADGPFQDCDWDWLTNAEEQAMWTDPTNPDSDWDWLIDSIDPYPLDKCNWDFKCNNWSNTWSSDRDHDRITDKDEILWWTWSITLSWTTTIKTFATSWTAFDTDCDWLFDWYERDRQLNAIHNDHDLDKWLDWAEVTFSSHQSIQSWATITWTWSNIEVISQQSKKLNIASDDFRSIIKNIFIWIKSVIDTFYESLVSTDS